MPKTQSKPPGKTSDYNLRLSARNQQAIADHDDPAGMQVREEFARTLSQLKNKALIRWYKYGGEHFIAWVKAYYRREDGQEIHWKDPYVHAFYFAMGTPWLARIIVIKGAQIGFSECLVAMAAFCVSGVRVPTGLGFEQGTKLQKMAPRVQKTFDHIRPIQQSRVVMQKATGRKDTDDKQKQMSVAGILLTLFYANRGGANSQDRQASSELSSFTAWVILADEIELWKAGTLEIAAERQFACEMPSKPFRGGSTPGAEGGIVDSEVRNAGRSFEWEIKCPHCGKKQYLHPFGNFLRPQKTETLDGRIEERHVDLTGRPMDWFSHDDSSREKKIQTAYIGCQHCTKELGWEAICKGRFICTRTGDELIEFCKQHLKKREVYYDTVAINLPRLASHLFKPPSRIRILLKTRNPADAIQQGLGVAVSIGGGKIDLRILERCIGADLPPDLPDEPDYKVLGVDQGVSHHWGMVQWWYFPKGEKDKNLKWIGATVIVKWWGHINGFDGIKAVMEDQDIDLVGIDNEPEIQQATEFGFRHQPRNRKDKHQVFVFDQVHMKGDDLKAAKRKVQGKTFNIYNVHRTFGLDAVRDRIYRPGQLIYPSGVVYDPTDDDNLIYHYMTSDRKDATWDCPDGSPDHYFHAHNFCEMAILARLIKKQPGVKVARVEQRG